MEEDTKNKIETLTGYVRAAGEGKYPFGDKNLIAVADEVEEWLKEITHA